MCWMGEPEMSFTVQLLDLLFWVVLSWLSRRCVTTRLLASLLSSPLLSSPLSPLHSFDRYNYRMMNVMLREDAPGPETGREKKWKKKDELRGRGKGTVAFSAFQRVWTHLRERSNTHTHLRERSNTHTPAEERSNTHTHLRVPRVPFHQKRGQTHTYL